MIRIEKQLLLFFEDMRKHNLKFTNSLTKHTFLELQKYTNVELSKLLVGDKVLFIVDNCQVHDEYPNPKHILQFLEYTENRKTEYLILCNLEKVIVISYTQKNLQNLLIEGNIKDQIDDILHYKIEESKIKNDGKVYEDCLRNRFHFNINSYTYDNDIYLRT